jgi:protein Mpv17
MIQRRVLEGVKRPQAALLNRRCFSASTKPPPPKRRQSIFARTWDSYSKSLYRRPLTTKATTAAIIFFTSDSAAQFLTRDRDTDFYFNVSRALSGSFFGIVATGYLHVWWGFLEGAIGTRLPVQQYRLTNTLVKVVVDQGLGAPFYIYSYYVVTNFLQRMSDNNGPDAKSPEQVLQETNAKASAMLWPTMLRHWRLWPLVHSFNFYFVPLHHRVLVQNLVLVGWSGCKYEFSSTANANYLHFNIAMVDLHMQI